MRKVITTKEEFAKFKNRKKSKYRSEKTFYNGIKFDSILEKDRYIVLKDYERRGIISNLELQVKYVLQKGYYFTKDGKRAKVRDITYIPDFRYLDKDGNIVVEDVKGRETEVYNIKKKMFLPLLDKFGVFEFREVYKSKIIRYMSGNQ